ncbi:hypothetical protein cypCar_00001990 [Cyprinus carpio]|nr:hypothetical protein cypCar_00001990 [Cyprinus carpio]
MSVAACKMSVVLFASVVRVRDGLPLSASTDYEQDKGFQETKKHLKGLSKKLSQFPDRCSLRSGLYNINFTWAVSPTLSIRSISEEHYLHDNFIRKTKQRYNSPRSLSTKINLADMQTEFKLRPPYQLSAEDIGTINGFSQHKQSKYKGIAPNQMLEAITLSGIVACVLSVLCGALNLLRGVHAIESVLQHPVLPLFLLHLQNEDEDFNYVIAFFLGTAACLYQCYLFAYFSVWRNIKSFLAFAMICLCNMYLYELRNMWQILFHVTVGAFITLQIHLRQPQGKSPDYNV